MLLRKFLLSSCALMAFAGSNIATAEDEMNLYWGDTHLHTSYSFDAFLNNNFSADPDTAYRWAKGQPVIHPGNRSRVQIHEPLDFLVVSDHAELMGVMRHVNREGAKLPEMGMVDSFKRWLAINKIKGALAEGDGTPIFLSILPEAGAIEGGDPVADPNNSMDRGMLGDTESIEASAWDEITDAAERHNDPGKFTTFIGWEWSSIPTGANLHRVVLSSTDGATAKKFSPYGSDQSQYPEDLWDWLDKTEAETGAEFLAIPHNSNISKGYMFAETTLKGHAITADYARRRILREPVAEITQIKGDSETHPNVSPDDAFADFESYEFHIQKTGSKFKYPAKDADYIRSALKTGLKIDQAVGVNPYKFGVIGSTDAHSGLSSAEENNFWGKFAKDSVPEKKRRIAISSDSEGIRKVTGWNMSASGLAAVWAPENTRQAIFNAFKRREVYGTTGPRMRVRFFGGWDFSALAADGRNIADVGYGGGVPMGSDLARPSSEGGAPEFLIQAVRDPNGANLDRVQVVKGWVTADGETHEKVYDVAWSGNRKFGQDGQLPAVGDTVDRKTGKVSNAIGTPELIKKWSDPDFDAGQRAFYYVRVLQIPTARHSLLDGIALGIEAPKEGPEVIQERAYTSPIWYTP